MHLPFDVSRHTGLLWELFRLFSFLFAVLGAAVWAWIRRRGASSWPSVQGTVMWAKARIPAGNRGGWVGELTYSYVVEGEYYSGIHQLLARSERRAEELVEGWQGRSVVVRYSRRKSDNSLLLKDDQLGGQLGN
jgi:hypothetical protein